MIADTSALVAIAVNESTCGELVEKLNSADQVSISSVSLLELNILLRRKAAADNMAAQLLQLWSIQVIDFDAQHAVEAIGADQRYGKGRHKAALNFGDCAAYATAKLANQPLLYVGDDFALTDIACA